MSNQLPSRSCTFICIGNQDKSIGSSMSVIIHLWLVLNEVQHVVRFLPGVWWMKTPCLESIWSDNSCWNNIVIVHVFFFLFFLSSSTLLVAGHSCCLAPLHICFLPSSNRIFWLRAEILVQVQNWWSSQVYRLEYSSFCFKDHCIYTFYALCEDFPKLKQLFARTVAYF